MPIQKVEASPEGKKPPLPKRWIRKKSKGVVKNVSFEKKAEAVKSIAAKVKKTNRKSTGGCPVKIDESTLRNLELCFMVGMNDREACIFCDIWESTLYDYQRAHPDFSEKKKLWKNKITLQAIINLGKDIKEWDNSTSKWWLERRARDKFGNRIGIIDDEDVKQNENEEDLDMYQMILARKKVK